MRKSYLIDGKDNRWQKLKITSDLNAVVGGVTLRQGVVNSLLLGLYDEKGMLYYIGHAGTGKLKKDEWTEGGILRQPSIQAFVDVPPEKCTFKNV